MLTRRRLLAAGGIGTAALLSGVRASIAASEATFPVAHSPEEWRKLLTAEQYSILREEGTEAPFTSPLLHEKRAGIFACAACGQPAFDAATKYDSGTGWPSFWQPVEGGIGTTRDTTFGMVRTAVHCARCGGHSGHVFTDGPKPTGIRYCINGVALQFHPAA